MDGEVAAATGPHALAEQSCADAVSASAGGRLLVEGEADDGEGADVASGPRRAPGSPSVAQAKRREGVPRIAVTRREALPVSGSSWQRGSGHTYASERG